MKHPRTDEEARQRDRNLIYQLEGRPRLRTALPLGMQHVLAMFASNLAPILIIAGGPAVFPPPRPSSWCSAPCSSPV